MKILKKVWEVYSSNLWVNSTSQSEPRCLTSEIMGAVGVPLDYSVNRGLTPSKTLFKINILQTNFAQQKNSISIMH